MKRDDISEKEIVKFLEFHNRPNFWGRYSYVLQGEYPIYKLNLNQTQLWILIDDFFSFYKIDNSKFRHDTQSVKSAVKLPLLETFISKMHVSRTRDKFLTVSFLYVTAKLGVWDEKVDISEYFFEM